jgi:hypothetical protein
VLLRRDGLVEGIDDFLVLVVDGKCLDDILRQYSSINFSDILFIIFLFFV